MAAAGGGPLRLRLLFDYPPPGSPGCALCWLLVEPSQVRLVTDLVSLIRHRFGFSRRARLSLFLEGALLPPTESARLVRDNDSLRVKLEEIVADEYEEVDDGFSYTPKENKKRRRQKQEEEEFSRNEDRHKREKKKNKHNPEYPSCREEISVDIWDSHKRYKKRKRKEEVSGRNRLTEGKEESSTGQSKKLKETEREKQVATKKKDEKQTKAAAAKMALEQANESLSLNSGKNNTKKITTQSRKKRVGASDSSSTSSDSDSSELKQSKSSHKSVVATLPKDKSQAAANSDVKTVVSNKVTVKSHAENSTKTAVSKNAKKSQSSSSDSDSSTEDEKVATAQDSTAKEKSLPNNVAAVKTSTTKAPKAKTSSSESDSSDSETLVIKKPTANAGLSNSIIRNCTEQLPTSNQGPLASPGRGRGRGTGEHNFWRGPRGRGFRGMMRGQGRGRGANPGFFYNYNSEAQKQRQLNEAATNTSVLVQNPVEVPKRDYSVLPLLAAPPQVGERIAFKRLELTENYSPEVSDYKEGKIISWNADKKQIELEILSSSAGQLAKEPGKFDLVYQSADGAELIEYAVPQDTKITESWDALIEPRLIVEPPVNGSSVENGTI
ncbi:coilin isoform X1 [Grus americana]|uniref:coilin isoform X1 n=1 Tax=Grus americana TaxID=9117 RepID=UPI0024083F1F|nr:coilin isoform X1 [Grus americana]